VDGNRKARCGNENVSAKTDLIFWEPGVVWTQILAPETTVDNLATTFDGGGATVVGAWLDSLIEQEALLVQHAKMLSYPIATL
jgi:hypothetical protein